MSTTWARTEGPFGIRLLDVGIVAVAIGATELFVAVGGGVGVEPLNATAYLLGAAIVLPVLFRHRWPLRVLLICFLVLMLYYSLARRDISPAPQLGMPVYDVAVAGYLAWAIAIPSVVMTAGLIAVGLTSGESAVELASNFLPSIILFVLAVMLGEVIRARHALAEETARRLKLAEEERAAEAGRLVAEERLRIARELHDTVAHSMATITVQAGSALHLLNPKPHNHNDIGSSSTDADALRAALSAIRETSKSALSEMRSVLGHLRGTAGAPAAPGCPGLDGPGLDGLTALRDAVSAAGTRVTVNVEGDPVALPAETDHAAYRILQESLTNVLRHAGPGAAASICLRYHPGSLSVSVSDNGTAAVADGNGAGGHGIGGMRERATSVGGTLSAGRKPGGGFEVLATLPTGKLT